MTALEAGHVGQQDQTQQYTMRDFARTPEYLAENQSFIDRTLNPQIDKVVLEVGCGTGNMTKMLIDRFAGEPGYVLGIDMNEANLDIAKADVISVRQTVVDFRAGRAEDVLPSLGENFADVAYFCNAIHEIPGRENKLKILKDLFGALKPGGKAHISSAFTAEMFLTRLELFMFGDWRKRAFKILGKDRDRTKQSFEVLSTEDYCRLMEEAGFTVDRDTGVKKQTVTLTADSLRAIAKYSAYIEGQFMDMQDTEKFTLEQKSQALIQAVDDMEKEYRDKVGDPNAEFSIKRVWAEITGTKPEEQSMTAWFNNPRYSNF